MKATMRAARVHEWGEPLRIDEVPIPEIGDNDVLVRVEACGLNGGDPHFINQDIRLTSGPEYKTPIRRLPITLGHEGAGAIARAGKEVRLPIREGDRVVIDGVIKCGFCYFCRTDQEGLCENLGVIGFTHRPLTEYGWWLVEEAYRDGTAAEFVKVPVTHVQKFPDAIPFDQASKLMILGTGYRATKVAKVRPGDVVIVNAATGGTGVPTLMCAKLFGASKIIAIARDRQRLEKVRELVDPKLIVTVSIDEDIHARVLELTGGKGAEVLIDLVPKGARSTLQCIYSLRNGGRVVLVGGCTEELSLPYRYLMAKEIKLTGTRACASYEYNEMIALISGGFLDLSKLVTHRFPLQEINEALDVLQSRRGDPIWVVVEP